MAKIFGIIALVLVIATAVLGFAGYGYINNLRNGLISRETQLNAQYLDNQNELSTYISGFYEQVGIVKFKSEKLDQILSDYAKGRSGNKGESDKAGFINAVYESVPDLKGLNIADRMLDYVQSGRASHKEKQSKLLDQLREYDTWRNSGLVQSAIIHNVLNAPSSHLEARIGTNVVTGDAARTKMYEIVLTGAAKDAYQSGTLAPLEMK